MFCRQQVFALFLLVFTGTVSADLVFTRTGFTYQGELEFQGVKANGVFDFKFLTYLSPTSDADIFNTSSVVVQDVLVENGIFTVEIDPGFNPFDLDSVRGSQTWLEIWVRDGADVLPEDFVKLSPRQKVTGAPYALPDRSWKWLSISALTLISPNFVRHVGFGEAYLKNGTPQAWATAPVNLPSGSEISGFKCHFKDNDPTGRFEAMLQNHKSDGSSTVTMAKVGSTDGFSSTAVQSDIDLTINYEHISNSQESYYLSVMLKGIQGPDLAVYSCRINWR